MFRFPETIQINPTRRKWVQNIFFYGSLLYAIGFMGFIIGAYYNGKFDFL
jgi:hypothetical protein